MAAENDDLYLKLAESLVAQIDGKPYDEQIRIVAGCVRRVSEMYMRALGALDDECRSDDTSEAG